MSTVLIGGTYQHAVEWCREHGYDRPNVREGPVWTTDYHRILGLNISRVIELFPCDARLRDEAQARLARNSGEQGRPDTSSEGKE